MVLGIGDSYVVGAVADGVKGGTAIPTGMISTLGGSAQANWVNPTCSWWPYMADAMVTQAGGTISGARIVRRGQVGLTSGSNTDGHVAGLRNDISGFGSPEVDVIVVGLGINNAVNTTLRDVYLHPTDSGGLKKTLLQLRAEFPRAPIILVGQITNTPASYPELAAIEAHKVAICSDPDLPFCRYIDNSDQVAGLSDAVHPGQASSAVIGARIAAAWLT